ncbi:hypothetical protein [Porphyromonas gingivalis]|uniref:hypothetical protein n=1 Tax=Porphyromonas gingivalis TaxID=837 RepID=UPI00097CDBAD|nr:hypothetical protein [Porphyromonas gingivalis]SJM17858.1 hypothetical protein PGIN_15-9_00807 [Porphyromonas gingivalis]
MNVNHHQAKRDRSYFEWSDKMQIVRKENGDIAMTETELVDFFGVTWRKLNYRLQLLLKTSHLHLDERDAGEEEVFVNGRPKGYAPLYPLSTIIALSFQLDSTEAYLFRKYIYREIHRPTNIITPIFLISKTDS